MKNKIIFALLATALMCTACSDQFLQDKRDYNNMLPIDIYKDRTQANAVFAVIYKQILERYDSPLCGADPLMRQNVNTGGQNFFLTEEIPSGYVSSSIVTDTRYNGDHAKNTKAGNHLSNPPYWNDPKDNSTNYNNFTRKTLFPTIYVINDYIIAIDRSRGYIDDKGFWDGLKGQAIFARAWLYFDAVREWGGVPYYCTENDMPNVDDRSPRMPIQECIDKICADFEEAAKLLPARWTQAEEGRFTSVAALAMISRVRLYAASPVFNASWDNTGSVRWEQALSAGLIAESAAHAAGYGSSVNSIEEWDKMFYAYDGVAFNGEAIIRVPKSDKSTTGVFNKWEDYIRPGSIRNGTQAGLPAPEQMITLFPMKDGKRPTASNGYDDTKFYRNRDPRFYQTFAFSGCQWPKSETQIWLYTYKFDNSTYRYTDGSIGDGGAQKKSRAIVWKMTNPNIITGGESTGSTDILEYRYAEILLNIAECYAAKGDAANCISYLKRIRQRVGISSADNYGLGNPSGKYALIEAVLYERFVELAYEGKRPWDMRRWLLYEGGAGFDPRLTAINNDNLYDPDQAWGLGWKIYDGKEGRPNYTKADNILTKLGLPRFSGTKHIGKVWAYKLDVAHPVAEANHPLKDHADLTRVPSITKTMSESDRNAAFDLLETFYTNAGLVTVEPGEAINIKYAMDSGSSAKNHNFLFAWRGWYYVYPIHYDAYTTGKGNEWIEQTVGWMKENATPTGASADEQNGTYVYCTVEN